MLRLAAAFVIGTAIAASPTADSAAEVVGTVTRVIVWAYATPPGAPRSAVFVRDGIPFGAVLETVADGGMTVRFVDDTEIRLGPQANLTIDDFVFDPARGREAATLRLGIGALRLVSGRMASEGISIATPAAGIGLRGTDVFVEVAPGGATYVAVDDGRARVTARVSGLAADVDAGGAVTVSADGTTISTAGPRPRPPGLGASPGGGFPTGAGGGGDGGASGGGSGSDSGGGGGSGSGNGGGNAD